MTSFDSKSKTLLPRVPKETVNGILLLNKPLGITSNAALQKVKHLFHAKKAGHTGSLDPLASGMLPICFGEATKFSQFDLDSDKTYTAEGILGFKTSTGDAAGEVIETAEQVNVSLEDLQAVLSQFQGESLQTPSMFSALKHQGVPLYKYARKGIDIQREARPIQVHELTLLAFDGHAFQIKVSCSKGTYIRNLVEDIGGELGVGAYVSKLHRLHTKGYVDQPMFSLDDLLSMDRAQLFDCLLPVDMPVKDFPSIILSSQEILSLRQGKVLTQTEAGLVGDFVRLYDENECFVGLGQWLTTHQLGVKRLINFNE